MKAHHRKKKGLPPAAAVLLLAGSLGVAGVGLSGAFGGSTVKSDGAPAPLLELEGGGDGATTGVSRDLLAAHGSYERGVEVRAAFFASDRMPAVPMGEPGGVGYWIGVEPPELHLGVVLVGEGSRRVVVDGRVLGVGDEHGDVRVVAIERGAMTVQWAGRRLTYDLDSDLPREFRAEAARRRAVAGDGSTQEGM